MNYRPTPYPIARYDENVRERFAIMTVDGRLTDVRAAGELYRMGWISRDDYLKVRKDES